MLDKLIRAHYDPELLGLQRLSFTARMKLHNPKGKTDVAVRGSWQRGKPPEVELARVVRDGKDVKRDNDFNKTIWTSLKYRARRLLDGLGHGFLHQRFAHFKGLLADPPTDGTKQQAAPGQAPKATVRKVGDKLELIFEEAKAGKTTFLIARNYRVVQLTNVAPVGISRKMRYEHTMRGGRNLVKQATMSVTIAKDSAMKQKGKLVMQAADGMTYRFRFIKVGRHFLPARLDRKMPATKGQMTIDLQYR